MSNELESVDKIDKALGKGMPMIKSASVKLLEKIAKEIGSIKTNNELDKKERKNLIALYEQLAEKVEQLQRPKIIMPDKFEISNPVKEVTIKNQIKEVVVSDKGWVSKMLINQLGQTKWLKALTFSVETFVKAVTDIGKYEGKNRALRVVYVDKKGDEQDLGEIITKMMSLINSIPRGSGGGSSASGGATDVSALALEVTLLLIKAKTDNIPALGQALAASSVPVVLTAAQLATLTPLSSITADTELPAAAALSDTLANPTTPIIGSSMLAWNNANSQFRRIRTSGSTNSLDVGLIAGTIAYGDAESNSMSTFQSADNSSSVMRIRPEMYNGATWDRVRGSAADGLTVNLGANNDITGNVAHDAADSGAPVKIGFKAEDAVATATMVADGDRVDAIADLDGVQIIKHYASNKDLKSTTQSVTATTSTAATNFGAVASTKNFITNITVFNSSATDTYLKIQDGNGGTTFWVVPCPKGGGAVITFPTPLVQPTANTALYFAANAAVTTLFVSIAGFQSKAY